MFRESRMDASLVKAVGGQDRGVGHQVQAKKRIGVVGCCKGVLYDRRVSQGWRNGQRSRAESRIPLYSNKTSARNQHGGCLSQS